MKYILVTGGVASGIGKNIIASSIGLLLKECDLEVTAVKIDPYINIDAGSFSPSKQGEVFVLNDGSQVNMGLGNYERFLDVCLCDIHSLTMGKICQQVIDSEREGKYSGETIRVIPHITDAIQEWIEKVAITCSRDDDAEICIIELGGTVGDMENMPFVEALRQFRRRVAPEDFCCVHITPVPRLGKERKMRLSRAHFETSLALGIHPDIIICRSEAPIGRDAKDEISILCDVKPDMIFNLPVMKHILQVPIELQEQKIIKAISSCLKINTCFCDRLQRWKDLCDIAAYAREPIIISLVSEHPDIQKSYASVTLALEHACHHIKARPVTRYIDSALLENEDSPAWKQIKASHCIMVPGELGFSGADGKIEAIKYAREHRIPFLGTGLGFQLAAIEFAKNKLQWDSSHELNGVKTYMPFVVDVPKLIGSQPGRAMCLGEHTTHLTENSLVWRMYDNFPATIERHRHCYEINRDCVDALEASGLKFVGKSCRSTRVEALELAQETHPYFIGVQFQPEYTSRSFDPSPLYLGLIKAGKIRKEELEQV